MMNFVAICLVVSSLAAAGIWSPSPAAYVSKHNTNERDDVIEKEGHRVVVVEYDQQGQRNTKVSISPSEVEKKIYISAASDALNNIKEASSVLPDLGQGLSYGDKGHGHRGPGPGELMCDAYGKCKHKIASAIEKAKDKVSGVAHDAAAVKKEMAYEAKDYVEDALDKAKGSAAEKAHGAKEGAKDVFFKAKDTAYEKAHGVKEATKDALGKARDTASEKAHGAREAAKETVEKAKGNLKEAKDLSKTIGEDVAGNVSERVEDARESILEKAKEAKQGTEHAAKRVTTGVRNFLVRFGQFLHGFLRYLGFPETLNGLISVINLLGFATAYGMSVWVTFISSHVLAGALPRQQFGLVQSKIYPVYFMAMACSIGLALLGHIPHLFSSKAGMYQGYNILASIFMVLTNSIYLEPRATKVMFERRKVEKEEGSGRREGITGETSRATQQRTAADPAALTTTTSTAAAAATTAPDNHREQEANIIRAKMVRLSERLKKLNTYSSILNVLTLMSLTWHLVYLGQSLHMTC